MSAAEFSSSHEYGKYPVLIFGGGRGGSALLDMFIEDRLVHVIGIVDPSPDAPGIKLAKLHNIPTYQDGIAALQACRAFPDCILYNLSNDDSVAAQVTQVLGDKRVATGLEARLFWQMVTNLKQLKAEFERSQNHLQAIIRNVLDGIVTMNAAGEIHGFNPAAERIFGYALNEVLGKPISMLLLGNGDAGFQRYLTQPDASRTSARAVEVAALHKDGSEFSLEVSLSDMTLNGEHFFTAIVRDITERKLAEDKLAHLAHHDFLTGLPNRALFLDRLECALALARRDHSRLAVLFLDLDGFKKVNDTHGHEIGDLLLKGASGRLCAAVRVSDVVARMGGDEFTFVLNRIGDAHNAQILAEKIVAALAEPFVLAGVECRVGGSIGISLFDGGTEDAETLLRHADAAMYQAKKAGKNTWRMYQEGDVAES
ncbi:MAG: diguanylate cyclase [Gallionella sp.]|nr:diguanylate cyclase [Gallionella sp.]